MVQRQVTRQVAVTLVVLAAVAAAVVALVTMDPTGARGPRTGSRYVQQVLEAPPVDPSLIGWDEATPLPIAMESPRGIAVDAQDRILVVGNRVEVFAAAGQPALQSAAFPFVYRAVAVDAQGRAFAATRSRVDELDLGGATLRLVDTVELEDQGVELTAIAATAAGVFVADARGCRVLRLQLAADGGLDAGKAAEVFAKGFFVPSTMDLTAAADGELVTVDPGRHVVQRRDGYGDVVRSFGSAGGALADFHGCCNPQAIAVLADARTVTAEKGLAATRVKVYDADGRMQSVVADGSRFDVPPDGPPILLDLARDSRGRVLVLDPERKQVRIFTERER